ncbi:hypothetical protein D3C85_1521140 [compost metagenome]
MTPVVPSVCTLAASPTPYWKAAPSRCRKSLLLNQLLLNKLKGNAKKGRKPLFSNPDET